MNIFYDSNSNLFDVVNMNFSVAIMVKQAYCKD